MLQILPQSKGVLELKELSTTDIIDDINSYIERCSCEYLNLDISFLNVIDACYVSTLCAAKHYVKYPKGNINWRVSSESVKEFTKDLNLGNSSFYV